MSVSLNGCAIESFKFPGGELQVRIPASLENDILNQKRLQLDALLSSSDMIFTLLLVVDAIRRINPAAELELRLPYFPYARQDRVCSPGEALSLKVMTDLINHLNCKSVTVLDPHSDVTPALLNRCKIETMGDLILRSDLAREIKMASGTHSWILVAPDAGAEKKVRDVAKRLAKTSEMICARKSRDSLTGQITSIEIEVSKDLSFEGRSFLILDDICDGGQTFIELAKGLKRRGAREIRLYVTHGIFSKGLSVLREYFDQVYCFHTLTHEFNSDPFLKRLS